MIKIFLSRPNPFTLEQDFFIKELSKYLKMRGIDCITLQAMDYSPYEVITCLNEMIRRCYGMVIVAFGHTFIKIGARKKDAIIADTFFKSKEICLDERWLTSVYCHIEGTIAYSSNLPILILNQKGIKREGFLKKGKHAYFTPDFELKSKDKISKYLKSREVIEKISVWEALVKKKYNFIEDVSIRY